MVTAMATDERDGWTQASRPTKTGKRITYCLRVLQQPQRARACGSGAKSCADRRPVDPPPIVEMRIYEGEGPNKTEITFSYNANFFLFATLENARPIAPGRAPPGAANCYPVLTGTPVAGMAYLDRPSPAGYFIFPDLSVRHEGKYRLSFALYEELKDPNDMDPEDRPGLNTVGQNGMEAHVSHRLEVKSDPFTVFSAKKFPGLTESTALSRTVAEQGCRVRIRRDVRMRRREGKGGRDYEEDYEAEQYDAARRTATPDNYAQQPGIPTPNPAIDGTDRPRSVSDASHGSYAPRRQSMEEMSQGYQANNGYSSMPPPQPTGYSQMPQYSQGQSQYQGQYAAPSQPAPSLMQPPPPPYSQPHQSHSSYQSQNGMSMNQQYGYMNQNYQQQSHYEQPRQEPEYAQPSNDYRRQSASQSSQQYPGPNQLVSPYNSMDQYNRPQMNQQMQPLQSPSHPPASNSMHMPNGHSLAPLKTLQPPAPIVGKQEPVSPQYQSPPHSLSANSDAHSYPKYESQGSVGQKRSFSSTFGNAHMNERLQQGARPTYGYDQNYEEHEMEEPSAMSYRRADGTHRQRRVPDAVAM